MLLSPLTIANTLEHISDRLDRIDARLSVLEEHVENARTALSRSKNPIIRGLFPWL